MKHPFAVKSTVVAALVSLASFAQSDSPPSTGSSPMDERHERKTMPQSGSDTTKNTNEDSKWKEGSQASFNKEDLDFVKEAVAIGRAEVRLSQLAATQASDPSVKELAQQMVSEHQSTNDELREILERRGYTLPMDSSMGGSTGSLGTTGTSGSIGSGSSSGTTGTDTPSTPGSIGTSMGTTGGSTGGTGTTGELGTSGGTGSARVGSSGATGSVGSGSTGSGATGSVGSGGVSGSIGSSSGSGASGSVGSSGASGAIGTGGTGSGNSIAIERSMQKKYDDKYQELSKLSGSKFDRAYLSALVDDHKKSVKLFEKASKRGTTDSELKSFATRTLPTLQQHLDRVQSIEKDVKGRRF